MGLSNVTQLEIEALGSELHSRLVTEQDAHLDCPDQGAQVLSATLSLSLRQR